MQAMANLKSRDGRRTWSGPSFFDAKEKKGKTSKSRGSKANKNALEASLNLVNAHMPTEALLPLAFEMTKKAKMEQGW